VKRFLVRHPVNTETPQLFYLNEDGIVCRDSVCDRLLGFRYSRDVTLESVRDSIPLGLQVITDENEIDKILTMIELTS